MGWGRGGGSGGDESERWEAADEASLNRPPLTSCGAARFLTGLGAVLGAGDPCLRGLFTELLASISLFLNKIYICFNHAQDEMSVLLRTQNNIGLGFHAKSQK